MEKFEKNLKQNNNPLIVKFKTMKELKNFCKIFAKFTKTKAGKSYLYSLRDEFILTVYILQNFKDEKKLKAILSEFGKIIGKGELKSRIIKEHCKAILKSRAIEEIAKLN